MSKPPSIGDIYLARNEDNIFLYTLIGTIPEYEDELYRFSCMVLLGGDHFSLSHESDYCRLRRSDRSPMFEYIQKHFGQPVPVAKECYDTFFPVNRFGCDPVQRGHTLVQSKKHLQGMLEAHFQAYPWKEWDIALDYYESLNQFKRLYSPRLSL